MAESKTEFIKLEPGQIYKIIPTNIPIEKLYIRAFNQKNKMMAKAISYPCQWCEDEQIHSRFEILDL